MSKYGKSLLISHTGKTYRPQNINEMLKTHTHPDIMHGGVGEMACGQFFSIQGAENVETVISCAGLGKGLVEVSHKGCFW